MRTQIEQKGETPTSKEKEKNKNTDADLLLGKQEKEALG